MKKTVFYFLVVYTDKLGASTGLISSLAKDDSTVQHALLGAIIQKCCSPSAAVVWVPKGTCKRTNCTRLESLRSPGQSDPRPPARTYTGLAHASRSQDCCSTQMLLHACNSHMCNMGRKPVCRIWDMLDAASCTVVRVVDLPRAAAACETPQRPDHQGFLTTAVSSSASCNLCCSSQLFF